MDKINAFKRSQRTQCPNSQEMQEEKNRQRALSAHRRRERELLARENGGSSPKPCQTSVSVASTTPVMESGPVLTLVQQTAVSESWEDEIEPVQEPETPVQEPEPPVQEPETPVQEPETPVQTIAEPVQAIAEPVQEPKILPEAPSLPVENVARSFVFVLNPSAKAFNFTLKPLVNPATPPPKRVKFNPRMKVWEMTKGEKDLLDPELKIDFSVPKLRTHGYPGFCQVPVRQYSCEAVV